MVTLAAWAIGLAPAGAKDAPAPARIVAVGDLHGDFAAWIDVARGAGLIDANDHWKGGATTLVQLGDIVDRGPDSLKIIRNLQLLAREAPRTGGKVIVILGNHEAMNVIGDLRYVTTEEFESYATPNSAATRDAYLAKNFKDIAAKYRASNKALSDDQIRTSWIGKTPLGWVEHRAAWAPSGPMGAWAAKNPAIVKIGDNLFVHGGVSVETSTTKIDLVNMAIAKAMAAADERDDSPLMSPLGPLWYRGLVQADADAKAARENNPENAALTPEQEVTKVLANYGAKRIIVGHTPAKKPIAILYGGKLARIDTAMSRFYGGPLTWLEISGDTMTPHTVARSGQ